MTVWIGLKWLLLIEFYNTEEKQVLWGFFYLFFHTEAWFWKKLSYYAFENDGVVYNHDENIMLLIFQSSLAWVYCHIKLGKQIFCSLEILRMAELLQHDHWKALIISELAKG